MLISYELLKEIFPGTPSLDKVLDLLIYKSVEVDATFSLPIKAENIIIGQIIEIKPHPNADRLQVTTVDIGNQIKTIVCGANNIKIGQKIPVILPGNKVANGMLIEKRTVRGIESDGMLCSTEELGLSDSSSGILILPVDFEIGSNFNKIWGSPDVINVSVTPNRGDLLSHYGIARELAALQGDILKEPGLSLLSGSAARDKISVDIKAPKACSKYIVSYFTNCAILESSYRIQRQLYLLGQRPLNNVVDVTNYVMTVLGQPLHAFDKNKLKDNLIIVRFASSGEKLLLLDGQEIKLKDTDLVIADSQKPIALAGIMGGKDSAISENTTDVILEAAHFNPQVIRSTSKRLHITTDASYRFERFVDYNLPDSSSSLAAKMITQETSGIIAGQISVNKAVSKLPNIVYKIDESNLLIGENIDRSEHTNILTNLGCKVHKDTPNIYAITPPSWRHDLNISEDLTEEVARVYGLNNISKKPISLKTTSNKDIIEIKIQALKDMLAKNGLNEVVNSSFITHKDAIFFKSFGIASIHILNPVSPENSWFRPLLTPNLLHNISKNQHEAERFPVFEIGNVAYFKNDQLNENTSLAVAIFPFNMNDTSFLKMLQEFLGASFECKPEPNLLSDNFTLIYVNSKPVGYVSDLSDTAKKQWKIKVPTMVLEISIESLLSNIKTKKVDLGYPKQAIIYKPLSKFPRVVRDINFIGQINEDKFLGFITDIKGQEDLENVSILSIYNGITTIRFTFRSFEKTLTDAEISQNISNLTKRIEKSFNIKNQVIVEE